MKRSSGVLLPVASLPSKYGIGCFDRCAYDFVDQLVKAGQSYWQILPMGPTGYGDSPYQAFSTFAGNPYFISPDDLVKKGYLTENDCIRSAEGTSGKEVHYDVLFQKRLGLLRKAYANSSIEADVSYQAFVQENSEWLADYALFMAIKDNKSGKSYLEWEDAIRLRSPEAMVSYRNRLLEDVNFYQFVQYEFYTQWAALKKYANDKGISIIGDIPIYVALDSADTWAHPELFQFDENGLPTAVAGCPPDGMFTRIRGIRGGFQELKRVTSCMICSALTISAALMNIMRFRMEMQPRNLVSGKKVRALSCLRLWRIKWENFRFLLRIWDF